MAGQTNRGKFQIAKVIGVLRKKRIGATCGLAVGFTQMRISLPETRTGARVHKRVQISFICAFLQSKIWEDHPPASSERNGHPQPQNRILFELVFFGGSNKTRTLFLTTALWICEQLGEP